MYCRERMQYMNEFADASTQACNWPLPKSNTPLLAVAGSYSDILTDFNASIPSGLRTYTPVRHSGHYIRYPFNP